MYPILGPGTPLPLEPGFPPSTQISPELSLRRPTMQLRSVVFPQPLAPSKPYLKSVKTGYDVYLKSQGRSVSIAMSYRHSIQTVTGAHPVSYAMSTGGSSPGA
jgi:hypothetical protein